MERIEVQQPRAAQSPGGAAQERGSLASTASSSRHRTACFRCRSARQRCDRREPCARCVAQSRPCSYPAVSNRGRKEGSANKPDTVEKLLLRISQSGVGEEVVEAILKSASLAPSRPASANGAVLPSPAATLATPEQCHLPPHECARYCSHAAEPEAQPEGVSPLDVLAAAVAAVGGESRDGASWQDSSQTLPGMSIPTVMSSRPGTVDQKLASLAQTLPRMDWQVLSEQPVESIFKLEASACDPVASRIIDDADSRLYFSQFFANHNQVVGLLDPALHTPDHVYATSFTLFSVICALGCAVSTRPRDRVIHHSLWQIAKGNMQWCIAASVASLETIQAIILMYHWAPAQGGLSEDPCHLHLCHAIQLARLTNIHKLSCIAKYVEASSFTDEDGKARVRRNYERCWLCLFNADKTFCGVNGSRICTSWNEVPKNVHKWWRQSTAIQSDRLVSGIAETRGILSNSLAEMMGANTTSRIPTWHAKWIGILEHVRLVRCTADAPPSTSTALLSFHVDHIILLLGAYAVRGLASDAAAVPGELAGIDEKSAKVANRMLVAIANDESLRQLTRVFSNSHFIMICHALADVRQAITKEALSQEDAAKTVVVVKAAVDSLNETVKDLPTSAAGRMYARLAQSLSNNLEPPDHLAQLENENAAFSSLVPESAFSTEWWLGDGFTDGTLFSDSIDFGSYSFDSVDTIPVEDFSATFNFD